MIVVPRRDGSRPKEIEIQRKTERNTISRLPSNQLRKTLPSEKQTVYVLTYLAPPSINSKYYGLFLQPLRFFLWSAISPHPLVLLFFPHVHIRIRVVFAVIPALAAEEVFSGHLLYSNRSRWVDVEIFVESEPRCLFVDLRYGKQDLLIRFARNLAQHG